MSILKLQNEFKRFMSDSATPVIKTIAEDQKKAVAINAVLEKLKNESPHNRDVLEGKSVQNTSAERTLSQRYASLVKDGQLDLPKITDLKAKYQKLQTQITTLDTEFANAEAALKKGTTLQEKATNAMYQGPFETLKKSYSQLKTMIATFETYEKLHSKLQTSLSNLQKAVGNTATVTAGSNSIFSTAPAAGANPQGGSPAAGATTTARPDNR